MRTAAISILILLAASHPGCIDANPSTFPDPDAGPVIVRPDVVRDTADDADLHAACRACLTAPEDPGPGCGSALAACVANEKCEKIYECGFHRDCWSLPTQTDIINCGFPCFAEAGVTDFADPAVTLIQAVSPCVLGPCQPACGVVP